MGRFGRGDTLTGAGSRPAIICRIRFRCRPRSRESADRSPWPARRRSSSVSGLSVATSAYPVQHS
jgi:hypothetical protein